MLEILLGVTEAATCSSYSISDILQFLAKNSRLSFSVSYQSSDVYKSLRLWDGEKNVNHALAKVLIRYFIVNCLKTKLKPKFCSQSWEQMISEALQKIVRIIWSSAFKCRLNYKPRITRPTYTVSVMGKKYARKTPSEVRSHIILINIQDLHKFI